MKTFLTHHKPMKFIRIFLLILIIIGLALLLTQEKWVPRLVEFILNNENTSETNSISQTSTSENSQSTYTFESEGIDVKNIRSFGNEISFTNSIGIQVVFKGPYLEARNSGSHVYVGNKDLGKVDGSALVSADFSEDNKLFNFSTMSVCGAICVQKENYQIDMNSLALRTLR